MKIWAWFCSSLGANATVHHQSGFMYGAALERIGLMVLVVRSAMDG
jgi:hypothetical protein